MIDVHVHTGQFNQMWYDPALVIRTVLRAGVEKVFFTSTTTCKENVKFTEIEKEIGGLLSLYGYESQHIRPLLWYRPDYRKQGIGLEKAMRTLPYHGIKIHPRAQNWDLSDKNTLSILHELFGYTDQNKLPVLIHTGYDKIDEADKFSRFFSEYPNAKIILAHCRPPDQVLQLLLLNRNVFFDTAFVDEKDIGFFSLRGLRDRILFGSDFPITHYTNKKEKDMGTNLENELADQYRKDLRVLSSIEIPMRDLVISNANNVFGE
jgi:hypothetical protein